MYIQKQTTNLKQKMSGLKLMARKGYKQESYKLSYINDEYQIIDINIYIFSEKKNISFTLYLFTS